VITIGQLARYAGVSRKTIRIYHAKGLLPEPDRDASGYRRYTAHDVIDVIKIRTLAQAGVPLARIRELRSATDDEFQRALRALDNDLTRRIRDLRDTQHRLRDLASGRDKLLPPEVARHVNRLREIGLSQRWIDFVSELWIRHSPPTPTRQPRSSTTRTNRWPTPSYGRSSLTTTVPTISTLTTPPLTLSPSA
jgi:DNA-binding transcriptional MerR regulator